MFVEHKATRVKPGLLYKNWRVTIAISVASLDHFFVSLFQLAIVLKMTSVSSNGPAMDYLNPKWPPLCIAARIGDLSKCKELVAAGVKQEPTQEHTFVEEDLYNKFNHEETPLFLAAKYGHLDVCKFLLQNGATDDANDKGETPLHIAVKHHHGDIVRMLLDKNFSPLQTNDEEKSPLCLAIVANDEAMLKIFIESEKVEVFEEDGQKVNTFLASAVTNENPTMCQTMFKMGQAFGSETEAQMLLKLAIAVESPDLVRVLLEHGANPNFIAEAGSTLLHVAAMQGSVEMCKVLLDAGAVSTRNPLDETPYETAAREDHQEVCELLWPEIKGVKYLNYKWPPLCIAARLGDLTTCRQLIEDEQEQVSTLSYVEDAEHRFEMDHQETPLFLAAKYGHYDVCKYLLENGATHDANDKNVTPYMIALKQGHADVCRLLLDNGASCADEAKETSAQKQTTYKRKRKSAVQAQ